jgi:Bacterial toxin homologue of phage lysozyme, C-term
VKTAFSRVGRLDEPKGGFSGLIDYPLDGAIRRFQRDNGLRADGFLRPGGPTQRTLLAQLRPAADARDEPRHRIDFDLISELEGGQRLEGYVPLDKQGRPSLNSGVTIATGFDIGQRSPLEIDRMDLQTTTQRTAKDIHRSKGPDCREFSQEQSPDGHE